MMKTTTILLRVWGKISGLYSTRVKDWHLGVLGALRTPRVPIVVAVTARGGDLTVAHLHGEVYPTPIDSKDRLARSPPKPQTQNLKPYLSPRPVSFEHH